MAIFQSPLGEPLRIEEWYLVTDGSLLSMRLGVYTGELVVVSEKVERWLAGEPVEADDPEGEYYLMHYRDFEPRITKLGFARVWFHE